jgi:MFS transporter, putative metabolite:H+ symporter
MSFGALGITIGDFLSGVMSQLMKSRKKVIALFLNFSFIGSLILLQGLIDNDSLYYMSIFCLGLFGGYWAVLITTTSEQFGTNLRATVTTSVPNLIRASAVILTLALTALKDSYGIIGASQIIALTVYTLSFVSLYCLKESFGIDLNFVEHQDGTQRRATTEEDQEVYTSQEEVTLAQGM